MFRLTKIFTLFLNFIFLTLIGSKPVLADYPERDGVVKYIQDQMKKGRMPVESKFRTSSRWKCLIRSVEWNSSFQEYLYISFKGFDGLIEPTFWTGKKFTDVPIKTTGRNGTWSLLAPDPDRKVYVAAQYRGDYYNQEYHDYTAQIYLRFDSSGQNLLIEVSKKFRDTGHTTNVRSVVDTMEGSVVFYGLCPMAEVTPPFPKYH